MTADLTGRMFTGPGPLHPTLTEERTGAIERVLRAAPHTSALLNAALPGPDARRVPALLLGPGGADLIDLDGDRPGTLAAAGHLRRLLPDGVPVTVTLITGADGAAPATHPDATPVPDGDPDALAGALRASVRSGGPARLDPADLITRLNLSPARLSFLQGRVLSALDGQGVPGVQVWVQAGADRLITTTDARGTYALCADQDQELEVGFVPPPRYRAPETLRLHPHGPHLGVEDTRLPERASRLSEDDIRTVMMQAMQARLETQLARDPQAWTDPARQLEAVTGDLRGQLRSAAQEVAARQQETPDAGAPLAAQVRHAADQLLLAAQRSDLTRDLNALNGPAGQAPQAAVQRAIDTLTGVTASRSSEQRRTRPLPARLASLHARQPLPVPDTVPALWTGPDLDPPAPQPAFLPASSGPDDGVLLAPAPRGPATGVVMADPRPAPAPADPAPLLAVTDSPGQVRPGRRAPPLPWIAGGLLVTALAAALTLGNRGAPTATPVPAPGTPAGPAATVSPAPATPAPAVGTPAPTRPSPRVTVTVTEQPVPAPAAPRVTVTAAPDPASASVPAAQARAAQPRSAQPPSAQPPSAQGPSAQGRPRPAAQAQTVPPRAAQAAAVTSTPARAATPPAPTAPAARPADRPEPATPTPDLPFIEPTLPAPKPPGGPAQTGAVPGTPTSDPVPPAPTPEPAGTPPPAADPASIPATPPLTPPAPTPGN